MNFSEDWVKRIDNNLCEEDQQLEDDPLAGIPDHIKYDILMYDKVGGYYGWSWEEYQETPPPITEGLSKLIDSKLSHYGGNSEGGGKPPLSYTHLSLILALAALFGSGDDE